MHSVFDYVLFGAKMLLFALHCRVAVVRNCLRAENATGDCQPIIASNRRLVSCCMQSTRRDVEKTINKIIFLLKLVRRKCNSVFFRSCFAGEEVFTHFFLLLGLVDDHFISLSCFLHALDPCLCRTNLIKTKDVLQMTPTYYLSRVELRALAVWFHGCKKYALTLMAKTRRANASHHKWITNESLNYFYFLQ